MVISDAFISRLKNMQFAHENEGPVSLTDLPKKYSSQVKLQSSSPWDTEKQSENDNAYLFLIPNAEFKFEPDRQSQIKRENRLLLAMELLPYLDDGKHWVLFTDGMCDEGSN